MDQVFVNLDELNEQRERFVIFKKVKYVIEDFSLRQFIDFQKAVRSLEDSTAAGDQEGAMTAIEMICKSALPTVPEEDINKITLAQASALVQLINNVYPTPPASEVAQDAGNENQSNADTDQTAKPYTPPLTSA